MTIEDILELTRAGYSKKDIALLSQAQSDVKTEPKIEPKVEPKTETKTEPKPETKPEPKSESQGMFSDVQFQSLLQSLNRSGAAIDVPPTYDVKSVLADHYKALMVGDKKEEVN